MVPSWQHQAWGGGGGEKWLSQALSRRDSLGARYSMNLMLSWQVNVLLDNTTKANHSLCLLHTIFDEWLLDGRFYAIYLDRGRNQ